MAGDRLFSFLPWFERTVNRVKERGMTLGKCLKQELNPGLPSMHSTRGPAEVSIHKVWSIGMQTPGMQFMGQPQFMGMRAAGPQYTADMQKQMAEEHQWDTFPLSLLLQPLNVYRTKTNFAYIYSPYIGFTFFTFVSENVWNSNRKCWKKTGREDSLRSRNRSWGCWVVSNPR